jgi:hypothetical protein
VRQTVTKVTELVMPLVFGSLGTAIGMGPVFWLDAVLLTAGAWLIGRDAAVRAATRAAALGREAPR